MSLSIWIPATDGTLKNQGLLPDQFTSINYTVENDGKLGKCLKTINGNIEAGTTSTDWIGENGVVFCGWFKFPESEIENMVNTTSTTVSNPAPTGTLIGWNHYNGASLSWTANKPYNNTFIIRSSVRNSNYYPVALYDLAAHGLMDKWIHVCGVIDLVNKKNKLYINGELVHQVAIPDGLTSIPTHQFGINVAQIWVGNGPAMNIPFYFNDLRIYNDIISGKEIHNISTALVLQYTLSGYTKNIVNTAKAITVPSNNSMTPIDDGVKTLGNNIDTYCRLPLTQDLQTGTTYTLSFHATPVPDGSKLIFGVGSQNASGQKYCGSLEVHGGYNTFTFTPPVDIRSQDGLYLDDSNRTGYPIVEMKWFKIEEGSKATPWVPSENDTRYSSIGLDDGIEYDVSGYGHNGEKFGNSITSISDTPRYNTATLFGSKTSYIKCGEITTTGFSDSYTFSWWAKASNFGGNKMIWAFSDGNHLNLYNCQTWNTLDGNNNPIQAPGTTTQVTQPTANVWHHFVITGDGTATKMYLDGNLYGQAKTYKPITGKQIYINGNNTGTSYKFSDLNISDYRIYATCLDAENIIALYNAPISVSSNGTLLTSGEFTEV